jgi:hypothetical protein
MWGCIFPDYPRCSVSRSQIKNFIIGQKMVECKRFLNISNLKDSSIFRQMAGFSLV